MGTNLLGMTEESFWRCTPRKLFALYEVYKQVNGLNQNTEQENNDNEIGYIDQLYGF